MMLFWVVLLNTTLSSVENRMNYDWSGFIKKSKGFIIDMECLFLSPNMYSSDFLVYCNSRQYQNILGSDGSLDWICTSFKRTKISISMCCLLGIT